MRRIQVGDVSGMRELVIIRSDRVQIPHPTDRVHLQFAIRLRDAPSVTCIARSIVQRYHELVAVGIREVVVFHSSEAEMQPYQGVCPSPLSRTLRNTSMRSSGSSLRYAQCCRRMRWEQPSVVPSPGAYRNRKGKRGSGCQPTS